MTQFLRPMSRTMLAQAHQYLHSIPEFINKSDADVFTAVERAQALTAILNGQIWHQTIGVSYGRGSLRPYGLFIAPANIDHDGPMWQSVSNSFGKVRTERGYLILSEDPVRKDVGLGGVLQADLVGILAVYGPKGAMGEYVHASILQGLDVYEPSKRTVEFDEKDGIPLVYQWSFDGEKSVKLYGNETRGRVQDLGAGDCFDKVRLAIG